jgi:hypothetical protein
VSDDACMVLAINRSLLTLTSHTGSLSTFISSRDPTEPTSPSVDRITFSGMVPSTTEPPNRSPPSPFPSFTRRLQTSPREPEITPLDFHPLEPAAQERHVRFDPSSYTESNTSTWASPGSTASTYQRSPPPSSAVTPGLPSLNPHLLTSRSSNDEASSERDITPVYAPLDESPSGIDKDLQKHLESLDTGAERDQEVAKVTAVHDVDDEEGDEDTIDSEERLLLPKPSGPPPIVHRWNIIPILLLIWFLAASGYYYYIRYVMLTGAYSIFVFAIEVLGWTSFAPYAILITRGVYSTNSPGLPPDGSPEAEKQAAWWTSPERNEPHTNVKRSRKEAMGLFEMEPVGTSPLLNAARPESFARSQGSNSSSAYGIESKPRTLGYTPLPQTWSGKMTLAPAPDPTLTRHIASPAPCAVEASQPLTSGLDMPYSWYRFHVRVLVPCYKEDLSVISSTVNAALAAHLPAMTSRTVYLLDDGKDDEKRQFIDELKLNGEAVEYISGRVRPKGEVNGKSGNLNNALRGHIFSSVPKNDQGLPDWTEISNKELIVIFDADMNCKQDFFLKTLEVMIDDDLSLTLTPQAFYNADAEIDIFNSINAQFCTYISSCVTSLCE